MHRRPVSAAAAVLCASAVWANAIAGTSPCEAGSAGVDAQRDGSFVGSDREGGAKSARGRAAEIIDHLLQGGADDAPLEGAAREAAFESLTRVGRGPALSALTEKVQPDSDREWRVVALDLVARIGGGPQLDYALRIADAEGDLPFELSDCVESMVSRNPAITPKASSAALSAQPDSAYAIAHALAHGAGPESVGEIVDLVRYRRDIAGAMLDCLALAGERWPDAIDETARATARTLLEDDRPDVARAAADCVARLEDSGSVETLIEWLGSDDDVRRDVAYWSIQKITGEHFRADANRWRAWHRRERKWRDERFDEVLDMIASGDEHGLFAALDEARQHPYFRAESAPTIAYLLDHADEGIRERACETLVDLGWRLSADAFAPSLDDMSPRIREIALTGLKRVTPWSLGPDRDAWQRALSGPRDRNAVRD